MAMRWYREKWLGVSTVSMLTSLPLRLCCVILLLYCVFFSCLCYLFLSLCCVTLSLSLCCYSLACTVCFNGKIHSFTSAQMHCLCRSPSLEACLSAVAHFSACFSVTHQTLTFFSSAFSLPLSLSSAFSLPLLQFTHRSNIRVSLTSTECCNTKHSAITTRPCLEQQLRFIQWMAQLTSKCTSAAFFQSLHWFNFCSKDTLSFFSSFSLILSSAGYVLVRYSNEQRG